MDVMLHLQKLGLTIYQSSVLSAIMARQNSTALEVSNATGVPYTKIYSVLESLEYMGFVTADLERPRRFKTVDVDTIADNLVKRHQSSFSRIKKVGEEVKLAYKQAADEFHPMKEI